MSQIKNNYSNQFGITYYKLLITIKTTWRKRGCDWKQQILYFFKIRYEFVNKYQMKNSKYNVVL